MVTIKEIANRIGVSPSEVSRVLNGTERPNRSVSPRTREMILAAAQELNYQPNMIARSLVKRSSSIVGAALYNIANPFFAQMAMQLEAELRKCGLQMLLSTTELSEESQGSPDLDRYLRSFLMYNVAGILYWNWEEITQTNIIAWHKQHVNYPPIVAMGRVAADAVVDRVALDCTAGAYLATEHLLRLGHERIAYAGNDMAWPAPYSKYQGYAAAMQAAGHPPEFLPECVPTLANGYTAGRELLQRENRPSAVVCCNDVVAVGIMRAAVEMGVKVPEQLAITGFDNNPLVSYTAITLTTVNPPLNEMAQAAVRCLEERIRSQQRDYHVKEAADNESGGCRCILVKPNLVVRESTIGRTEGGYGIGQVN